MKKILGLDLGTNSIGWSLINLDFVDEKGQILGMGSRIIPMDADLLKNFETGNSISKTANRRMARGARRLKQRYKLRRERLIRVLKILNWVPEKFPEKFESNSKHNINDFLPFSEESIEECAAYLNFDITKLPNDWVIYYLRKKGLTEKLTLTEFARVLYHFNQRRGFKSNRKGQDALTINMEDLESNDEKPKNESRIEIFKVVSVFDTGEVFKGKRVFEITTDREITDGKNSGTINRYNAPEWENTEQELEVKIKRTKSGTSIIFGLPEKTDWKKNKEAIEKDIEQKDLFTGEYFLQQIKNDPNYRVRQRVIDRQFFIDELKSIWECQTKFHPELSNNTKLPDIAQNLYNHNTQKQKEIKANDIFHAIINDIIYYQRDLKSQKSSIGNCRFEKKNYILKDKKNKEYEIFLKVAPVSHPLFQVFRIWKTIHNIRVIELQKTVNGKIKADVDVTEEYINHETKSMLFSEFDKRDKIKAGTILSSILKLSKSRFRLNYTDDTEFPGNETKHFFRKAFKRFDFKAGENLIEDQATLEKLWHLFYSVADHKAIANSLERWFEIETETANKLSLLPPFSTKYGAYSQKALRKLIQVMECGNYWNYEKINPQTQKRIQNIIDGEVDDNINDQTRKILSNLNAEEDFQGLSETLASYVVYGRHSEREGELVENLEDIEFPRQNSLRNPIVEQVLNETLKLTKAVCEKYGRPDEIRVEMARDMNRNAKEREKLSKIRDKNRDIKLRISAILRELKIGNPDSPADVEKLRLLEENGNFDRYNSKNSIFKKDLEPTKSEIDKYRLWIEQNCVSPYTGKPIMLSKLFTSAYEVEHIIPKSRFFDDSLGNKVIVEEWANGEKDNSTAMQYIRTGSAIGKLLTPEDYIAHVNNTFFGKKRKHLLEDQIPKGFIDRQKNDTRFIIKQVNKYLTQFIENDKIRISLGEITNELKQKWGLNEMMKRLLIPRFERLEKITGEKLIIRETNEDGARKIHLQGYEKRIDHRHHALDALITACTTNQHVQYLNTLEGQKDPSVKYKFKKLLKSDKTRDFRLPWKNFIADTYDAMESIIVSHKSNNRILSKGINRYFKYVEENGKWVKKLVMQKNDKLFSIKNSLHKETIAGKIKLRKYKNVNLPEAIKNVDFVADKRIKTSLRQLIEETGGDIKKIKKEIAASPLIDKHNKPVGNKIVIWYFEEFSVSREALNESFSEKKIKEKVAEYDTQKEKGIKKMLLSHLNEFDGKPKEAFTGEGLEKLWKRAGHPITKVSTYETKGNKFEIRPGQLVEAAKGTNLFFVIYENLETGERDYETLGFNDVVAAKMNNLPIVKPRDGFRHFTISPNDLAYVPEPDENIKLIDWENDTLRISKRIYKMVSSTGRECHFVPNNATTPIVKGVEFGSMNKSERSLEGIMIKKNCIKIEHDLLGNIH